MDFSKYVSYQELSLRDTKVDIKELVNFLLNKGSITELTLINCRVNDEDAKELANLANLKKLNLFKNEIGNEGVKELIKLTNIQELKLLSNKISGKGIEALAKSHYLKYGSDVVNNSCAVDKEDLYRFLVTLYYLNKSIDNLSEDSVKREIFNVARCCRDETIKYILSKPDKYPFLINSQDKQGHTLSHFYTDSPEMQKFLFERGMIPEQEMRDEHITRDGQSVHASPIVKRTNFFAKKLVESMKANKEELKQAADSYAESIGLLKQYQNDSIRLKLLSLTESEKRSVMEVTLRNGRSIPNDEEFIRTVIDKAEQALAQQYLRKNRYGEYDHEYSTQGLQYNDTRDDAKITIPESIGYIKLLINNFSIPLREKKELLVTLIEQNPELVRGKLSVIRKELGNSGTFDKGQFHRTELHELLNGINDGGKINRLFKEISGLDIENVWKEQKEFVLLKQIYIAATTYGEDDSACIPGTWSQIIGSINEISSKIVVQYNRYLEEEQKQEMRKNAITKENIKPFMEGLANKLIQYVELNPELKKTLEDFVVCIVDIDKPEEVTFEQQKILAEINKYFSKNIKDVLHNYDRNIPRRDEYNLIIEGLPEVGVMQKFVELNPEVSSQQEINVSAPQGNNIQNNSQQSSDATPRIEKRSKLPIITASAGLLLGLSIAYLAGAATLTPVGAVGAVFLAAAVVGTLVGYGVGKFYEKVSSKLSDVSTKQPGLPLQA